MQRKCRKKGETVEKGTAVRYVVVKGGGGVRDRSMLPEEVQEGGYDPDYYLTHQVIPSVEKILEVIGYEDVKLLEKEQSRLQSFFS